MSVRFLCDDLIYLFPYLRLRVCLTVWLLVNSFRLHKCAAKYRHEWVTSWNTHMQREHKLAEEISEKEGGLGQKVTRVSSIATGMERCVPRCEASQDEAKLRAAGPFLCLMTRSWCLILASQHWGLSVCMGEKGVRWGVGGVTKWNKNLLCALWYNRCYRFVAELQDFSSVAPNIKYKLRQREWHIMWERS